MHYARLCSLILLALALASCAEQQQSSVDAYGPAGYYDSQAASGSQGYYSDHDYRHGYHDGYESGRCSR
jgi:hypothetical protein